MPSPKEEEKLETPNPNHQGSYKTQAHKPPRGRARHSVRAGLNLGAWSFPEPW